MRSPSPALRRRLSARKARLHDLSKALDQMGEAAMARRADRIAIRAEAALLERGPELGTERNSAEAASPGEVGESFAAGVVLIRGVDVAHDHPAEGGIA